MCCACFSSDTSRDICCLCILGNISLRQGASIAASTAMFVTSTANWRKTICNLPVLPRGTIKVQNACAVQSEYMFPKYQTAGFSVRDIPRASIQPTHDAIFINISAFWSTTGRHLAFICAWVLGCCYRATRFVIRPGREAPKPVKKGCRSC